MNTDEFEQKLSRQPLRQVPPDWRSNILAAAHEPQTPHPASRAGHRPWLSTLNSQLSTVFWPHPKAWAGLAAVWVFILLLNFSLRDKSPVLAEKSLPPSPEVVAQLQRQQRMFAELAGLNEPHDMDRKKIISPRPRSERVETRFA
jgi:hypothetical protein